MAMKITNETFDEQVMKSELPVLVDFWATWCGPCKMLAPVIDEISAEQQGKVNVGKIDIDENPDLAARFGVMNIPTVILFKDGEEVSRSVGLVPKDRLLAML